MVYKAHNFPYLFSSYLSPFLRRVEWIINIQNHTTRRQEPNLRCCPFIFMKGLRETTTKLNRDCRSPDWDINPGSPEHNVGVLTRLRCSVEVSEIEQRRYEGFATRKKLSCIHTKKVYNKFSYRFTKLYKIAAICPLLIKIFYATRVRII